MDTLNDLTNEVLLTEAQCEALQRNLRVRDEMAMKLGGATFEYEKMRRQLILAINQNVREEQQLMAQFLSHLGVEELGVWRWAAGEKRLFRHQPGPLGTGTLG